MSVNVNQRIASLLHFGLGNVQHAARLKVLKLQRQWLSRLFSFRRRHADSASGNAASRYEHSRAFQQPSPSDCPHCPSYRNLSAAFMVLRLRSSISFTFRCQSAIKRLEIDRCLLPNFILVSLWAQSCLQLSVLLPHLKPPACRNQPTPAALKRKQSMLPRTSCPMAISLNRLGSTRNGW